MKVTIAGNAVVFTSEMTLEGLETIKKYRPKALTLMGGENNKEELFCVDVAKGGCGNIGEFGAIFADATHDEAKKACITICMNGVQAADIKGYIADKFGAAWKHMNTLEATLPTVLSEVLADRAAMMGEITAI